MTNPDEDIVSVLTRQVMFMLQRGEKTLAVAESSTGGLIGHLFTNIPGCSEVFLGGVIAYHDRLKERLGVSAEILEKDGAVSATVAEAMAHGVRERSGADIGLAVTGILGPSGRTATKAVGLTYIAVSDSAGVAREEHRLTGDREVNKLRSAEMALRFLEKRLMETI